MRVAGRSLTFDVTDALALAVMSAAADTGSFLVIEARIQKQHGVSRITTREAIKILAGKGLLSLRPRSGPRVEPETNWNWLDPDVLRWSRNREYPNSLVRELTEFRLAIEPAAAAMAADVATLEQKQAIKAALELIAGADVGEEDPLKAKITFHRAILCAADNRFFLQAAGAVETGIFFEVRLAKRLKAEHRAGVLDYARVYRAINSGDGKTAQCSLRTIIQDTLDSVTRADAGPSRASGFPRTRNTRLRK